MRGVKDAMMQFSVSLFHTANFTRFLQPVKFQRRLISCYDFLQPLNDHR